MLVFFDTFYQNGVLQRFLSKLASILAPVLYGAAIAYLLTPVMSWLEKTIRAGWKKLFPKRELKPRSGGLRLVSILLTEAALLMLPAASRSGSSCGFLPALFTATSATCVTGLTPFDTWTQWSGLGQPGSGR